MSVVALLSSRRGGLGTCEREALRAALRAGLDLDEPVVAIAATGMGDDEPALKIALRAGCARAIAVDVDPLELGYLPLARALASAVESVSPVLVLCGDQSETSRRGAIGPAVAEILELPHLTGVLAVEVVDRAVRCRASLEGAMRWFAVPEPAVLCLRSAGPRQKGAPALRRTGAVVEHHSVDVEGQTSPAMTRPVSVPPRGGGAITGSPADLIRRLRDDHLLGSKQQ